MSGALREIAALLRADDAASLRAFLVDQAGTLGGDLGVTANELALFGALDEREFETLGVVECSPARQPDGSASVERAAAMIEAALRDGSTYVEAIGGHCLAASSMAWLEES